MALAVIAGKHTKNATFKKKFEGQRKKRQPLDEVDQSILKQPRRLPVPFLTKNYRDAVRDHCHLTGKYRGAAHSPCNLKLRIRPEVPITVVLNNLKWHDVHLLFRV